MLIAGGRKAENIDRVPLLRGYHEQFRARLNSPGARLVVIGYSFSDPHIDRQIRDAATNGLKLFIVDPVGVDVLEGSKSNRNTELAPNVWGASRRPIVDIYGSVAVELTKLSRFMAGPWP
jgi:hypothetical protein